MEQTIEQYVERLDITIEPYVETLNSFAKAMTNSEVAYPEGCEVLESAINVFLFAFVFCASKLDGIEQVALYNAVFSNLHRQSIELLQNYNEFVNTLQN
jgi:hypothetical protein